MQGVFAQAAGLAAGLTRDERIWLMLTSRFSEAHFVYPQASARAFEALQLALTGDGALMQHAALAIARLAGQCMQTCPQGSSILVLAGPGNNGKDALLAMQTLSQWGWDCQALEGLEPETLATLDHCLPEQGLVIDGWLGLGQRRALSENLAAAVDRVNRWRLQKIHRYCLSIDLPTGLHPDLGRAWPIAIEADACLSLLRPLRGLFTGQARAHWASHYFAPLISPSAHEHRGQTTHHEHLGQTTHHEHLGQTTHHEHLGQTTQLGDHQDHDPSGAQPQVPPHRLINDLSYFSNYRLAYREADAHKGLMGDVLLVGGAHGMDGALRLAAQGCLAIGTGKCFVLTLNPRARLDGFPAQIMQGDRGLLASTMTTRAKRVAAIGCGLGVGDIAADYLQTAIASMLDLVLDADALNLLAADHHLLQALRESMLLQSQTPSLTGHLSDCLDTKTRPRPMRRVVLTPHPLEAARLLGISRDELESDRFMAVSRLVDLTACTVILKGAGSLVKSPGVQSAIVNRSAPALAQAGSGDMLCGMLAALLARHSNIDAQVLAMAAAFLHADAAACWTESMGRSAAMPFDDLADLISKRFGQMV